MVIIHFEEYVKRQFVIAFFLNVGHIICGYSVGWSGVVIHKLQEQTETPLTIPISVTQASWVGSSLMIGVMIGTSTTGPLSNAIGRRWCMVIAGATNLVAQIIFILSKHLAMVLSARVINGIAAGIISVVNVVYIGEIASPNIRGIILTSTGVFHALGSLFVYSIGPYISYAAISYVILAVTVLYMLGTIMIPESPIFYIIKGNMDAAKEILLKLGRGKDMEEELKKMEEKANVTQQTTSWKELFTYKFNRKSLIISFLLVFFQQWSGVFIAMFFAATIFECAGSSIAPALSTIILGATQLAGTIFIPFLIEKSGRRTLLLISTGGCFVNMVILSTYFYLDKVHHPSLAYIRWLPLATLVLSSLSFSIGLNVVPNTITGELYRPNVRSIGSSLSMTLGCFTGFLSITSFGYLVDTVGTHWTFSIFAIINALGFVFTFCYVPETKGLTLLEIENMLSK